MLDLRTSIPRAIPSQKVTPATKKAHPEPSSTPGTPSAPVIGMRPELQGEELDKIPTNSAQSGASALNFLIATRVDDGKNVSNAERLKKAFVAGDLPACTKLLPVVSAEDYLVAVEGMDPATTLGKHTSEAELFEVFGAVLKRPDCSMGDPIVKDLVDGISRLGQTETGAVTVQRFADRFLAYDSEGHDPALAGNAARVLMLVGEPSTDAALLEQLPKMAKAPFQETVLGFGETLSETSLLRLVDACGTDRDLAFDVGYYLGHREENHGLIDAMAHKILNDRGVPREKCRVVCALQEGSAR